MKFGKHFERQKVPEWTEANVDYNGLMGILREIVRYKQQSKQTAPPSRALSLYRSFSGLIKLPRGPTSNGDIEDQVIDVNLSRHEGSRPHYRTDFLRQSEEGGDIETKFFEKLDDDLNKVNAFYKAKVDEVMNERDLLNKLMDALIALRIKVRKPHLDGSKLNTDGISVTNKEPSTSNDSTRANNAGNYSRKVNECREDPLNILENVKIYNARESPMSMLRGVLKDSKDVHLSFNKAELREVENRLRRVFIEFYQKLHLLKHYSFMNLSAFAKILKKYEKITSRRVLRSYMETVESSHIGNSDEISALMERVEAIFVKYFANSDRKKGIKSLRPKTKKEKHRVTFFSGFFSGCSVALVAAVVLRIQTRNLMEKPEGAIYMDNVFPFFFGYVILHMLMYAANIYFWRRYKINYPFLFGFKKGTELGYRDVFLLATGLAVLALVGFLANLSLDLGSRIHHYKTFTQLVPLVVVTVVLFIIFCPFDIIYRLSRFFFLRCIFRCICAPLYKVTMPNSILADNLTSQVSAFRCIELYICYYCLGEYSERQRCHSHGAYDVFYFVAGVIPFWMIFLQCLRSLWEDRDAKHAFNCLKYFVTIVAVLMRTVSELRSREVWIVLGLVSSSLVVIMNTFWDVVVDWGLLRRHSRNSYLRDRLLVPHKSVYFAALVLDIVLRIAWMQLVLEFSLPALQEMAASTTLSCLEIVRRGIWNFFRLENEQVNNVGQYRAFKSVPHPFSYCDDDDDDGDDNDDADDDHPDKEK
ncbi:hypothetical protein CRG98_004162 [Punica granatum]|uniref:Phosphate transporter PHO1 homolog 10-like n=1 Tax=Punica granatum TaxID=22663 RepID=A0A2I0L470_PUNGR|nr:hypothetical protein CRG98_004162 [Punica granatum]